MKGLSLGYFSCGCFGGQNAPLAQKATTTYQATIACEERARSLDSVNTVRVRLR
jgi:hypothetical protein